ncbi:hypothetical protein Bhyg_05140 [Pseudolycoriella hygida]|uniref:Uncharacterized protein n=1 Tax=Pseudolycoriella hygida TaxID=35572 RepID=A0A9Q0S8Y4_9DIPT|nr:hypothetical protein Bhyg_05140 [Pseudolycoriella hygida]
MSMWNKRRRTDTAFLEERVQNLHICKLLLTTRLSSSEHVLKEAIPGDKKAHAFRLNRSNFMNALISKIAAHVTVTTRRFNQFDCGKYLHNIHGVI